jgi:Hemopexin
MDETLAAARSNGARHRMRWCNSGSLCCGRARALWARATASLLAVALASGQSRAGEEHAVYTTPDGFISVLSDTDLGSSEAAQIARRIADAYSFDRQQDRWSNPQPLDSPITVRIPAVGPQGLIGLATAPNRFLIQLDWVRQPTSAATLAHELTHLQDYRELGRSSLPHYWMEGRADSNAFAYRDHLGLGQNPDWKRRLARWTSADARGVLEGTVTYAQHGNENEEVGTLWFEHLRRRFPDAHPRSARMITAIAAGQTLEQAYQAAFGESLARGQAEFLAYLDRTQADPDARVAGTWMQSAPATAQPPRAARASRQKAVSAAVEWTQGKVYLFRPGQYSRYDSKSDAIDPGFPRPIDAQHWPGFPWLDGFDAAVNWGNGKVYFFKGDQFLRYDLGGERVDPGYPERMTADNWPRFPWIDGFDAAVNWGDGKLYFFRDGQYLRYDLKSGGTDPGFPRPLGDQTWPGVPLSGGVDAAVNFGNGKAYFFSGDSYYRFDIAANHADPGFPKSTSARWK